MTKFSYIPAVKSDSKTKKGNCLFHRFCIPFLVLFFSLLGMYQCMTVELTCSDQLSVNSDASAAILNLDVVISVFGGPFSKK